MEKERDLLEQSWGVQDTSRLSCQVRVTPAMNNTVVEFPAMSEKEKFEPAPVEQLASQSKGLYIEPKKYESITKSHLKTIMKKLGKSEDALDLLAVA